MVKNQILKRAGYIGAAAMLMLTAAPITSLSNVSAAPLDHCATSVRNGQRSLSTYLRTYGEGSLCADMSTNSGLTVMNTATIDLNGHTFTGNINAWNATVTIYGDENGVVSGNLNTMGSGKFVIYGGTFTSNPSDYVASGYYAKRVNNRWVVLKEATITASDVIVPVNGSTKLFDVTPAGDVTYVVRDASGADVTASAVSIATATVNDTTTGTVAGLVPGTYTATITSGGKESTANITVYSYEAVSDMVLFKGDSQDLNITTTGANIPWTVKSSTDPSVASTDNGKVTALSAGTTTITIGFEDTLGTTLDFNVKVYDYNVTSDEVWVAKGRTMNYTGLEVADGVTVSAISSDTSIADLGSSIYRIVGRNSGDTVITYTLTADGQSTTVPVTVHVYASDYSTRNVSGTHDVAQGGTVEFTISEGYDQDAVTYADDLGFDITKDENGNYTVNVPEYMAGGEYVLRFTDKIGNDIIATQNVTIRVHEIVTSVDELYMQKGDMETITAKEAHNYASICHTEGYFFFSTYVCNVEVRDANGAETDALTVTGHRRNDNFDIRATAAGSYTITFSDGIASKTISVYVFDFTVEDAEYHIAKGDTAPKLVKAMNDYWNETSKGDTTGFVITKENDVNYYFWPSTAEAGKYTLTFSALANGQIVDTKTVDVYLYEMTAPSVTEYYGSSDHRNIFSVNVDDEINDTVPGMAEISYEVTEGDADGISVDVANGLVEVTKPGKYTVVYTDTMDRGDGDIVGTYAATFEVIDCEYDFLMVQSGEQTTLSSSTSWSVDLARDLVSAENLEITDNEVILDTSDMALGAHSITLYHQFGERQIESLKHVILVVYSVVASEDSEELNPGEITTETLKQIYSDTSSVTADLIRQLMEGGMPAGKIANFVMKMLTGTLTDEDIAEMGCTDLFAGYQAKFGADEWNDTVLTLNEAAMYGDEVALKVHVEKIIPTSEEKSAFEAKLSGYNTSDIQYYDISVLMQIDGETIGKLHELNDAITVAIAEVEDPATGYTRKYIVARMHDGEVEILEEGKDFYIENGIIYVVSDKFSTYAVAYQDTLIPASAPNTGAATESASSSASSDLAVLTTIAIAAITLAGAAIFAKRK